ncbi:glutaredoxin family protein [Zobellella maritima]|uniref:glutaredoxin family protein n=1 Tax=Zobellella maritima TaxID=2059725 RepID=UPI000E306D7D|nr:glutaredoxin family protein [Zobellella maritima]
MMTLFSTDGCHLCEQAWQLLEQNGVSAQTELKDIMDNEQWLADYRVRIPVLRREDGAELNWPFTAADLIEFNRVRT